MNNNHDKSYNVSRPYVYLIKPEIRIIRDESSPDLVGKRDVGERRVALPVLWPSIAGIEPDLEQDSPIILSRMFEKAWAFNVHVKFFSHVNWTILMGQ